MSDTRIVNYFREERNKILTRTLGGNFLPTMTIQIGTETIAPGLKAVLEYVDDRSKGIPAIIYNEKWANEK